MYIYIYLRTCICIVTLYNTMIYGKITEINSSHLQNEQVEDNIPCEIISPSRSPKKGMLETTTYLYLIKIPEKS